MGTTRVSANLRRDDQDQHFRNGWGAGHPAAANFGMADGSVRRINYTVDESVLQQLLRTDLSG